MSCNRGASHASTAHTLVAIARYGTPYILPLGAHCGEHASVILRSPAAETCHFPLRIHRAYLDYILGPFGASAVPSFAVQAFYIGLAGLLVIAGSKDMGKRRVLCCEQV